MPLTRGDKMIIAGAVGLAVTVVLGLAVLKKPQLFSRGSSAPTAAIPPAPTAESAPAPAGALPLTAPPAAVTTPIPAPAPVAAPVAAPTPQPMPSAAVVAPPAAPPTGKAPLPKMAGDESLEKMFEDLANEAPAGAKPAAGKPGQPKADAKAEVKAEAKTDAKAAAPAAEPTPAEAAALPEPQAAPAPGSEAPVQPAAPAKPETKPETKAAGKAGAKTAAKTTAPAKAETPKSPAAAKPQAAAKPEAKPAPKGAAGSGNVLRVIAEERPGEYVLIIQTNKSPASFARSFYTDPPRLVLDIAGSWNYNGPLSSATGDAFIRQIRVGKHPDKFRVVLDMSPDAPAKLRGAPVVERVPEGVALKIPK